MISSKQSNGDDVSERIESLLESSVDLDQIVILRSEEFLNFEDTDRKYLELLQTISRCAMENGRKILEARKLIMGRADGASKF